MGRILTTSARVFLVTGVAGFIGANLIRRLAAPAVRIRVLDNLSAGRRNDLAELLVEFIQGDIRDAGMVNRAVDGVQAVIHLAAHTNVIESVKSPELNFNNNVQGTFNLLQASVKHGVGRFIFASTGGAIVGDVTPPVHEDMAPHPISPYGAGKLAGEGYCSAFWGAYGLKAIAFGSLGTTKLLTRLYMTRIFVYTKSILNVDLTQSSPPYMM